MDKEPEIKLDLDNTSEEDSGSGEVEFSETEQDAIEHGWNPEGVDGKRNLSAEEFMDRKPLYDKIHANEKKMKRLQESMDAFKVHHEKVAELERAKAVDELKNQKKIALENEDYDTVIDIDDKIAEHKAVPPAPQANAVFDDWIEENVWYNQDSEMKEYADTIGNGYAAKNPNKPLIEVYEFVASETKKRFPDKFGNPRREAPSPVEASPRRRASSKKLSARDLPEEDYRMMKTIIRGGGISEEQYLKEYAELESR